MGELESFRKKWPWMNSNFLFRMNYGSITEEDRFKAASFLYQQYYAILGQRRLKTMDSICRTSLLNSVLRYPWSRPAIRTVIQSWEPFWDEQKFGKEDWRAAVKIPIPVIIGILDPELAKELMKIIYPKQSFLNNSYKDFMYSPHNPEARSLLELEVQLCHITREHDNYYIHALRDILPPEHVRLPFAAIFSDIRNLVSCINRELPTSNSILSLRQTVTNFLYTSPECYLSNPDSSVANGLDNGLDSGKLIGRWQESLRPSMPVLKALDLWSILLFDNVVPPGLSNYDHLSSNELWPGAAGYVEPTEISTKALLAKVDNLKLDFSSIDAAFICSGRFRLMLTTRIEQHFLLDGKGYLYVYWNFEQDPGSLKRYENHFFWNHDEKTQRQELHFTELIIGK
jgi:hypothetical protein